MTIREGRRRGNPNWGKKNPPIVNLASAGETAFEKIVSELGLKPEEYSSSPKLRAWAQKHMSQRYVPEELLVAWKFEVKLDHHGI